MVYAGRIVMVLWAWILCQKRCQCPDIFVREILPSAFYPDVKFFPLVIVSESASHPGVGVGIFHIGLYIIDRGVVRKVCP